jgi:regulation of enolase protein 1 (concanavalin A-like superfamily)
MNSSIWGTFINPLGDATTSVNGTTVSISVPAGTDHDIWKGDTSPSINAPRFMQSAMNTDFTLQVKMNTGFDPGARYQTQGILVQQDANRVLRFEFYGDGTNTFVYAGQFYDGAGHTMVRQVIAPVGKSPLYMKIQRVGNVWTQSYSFDGNTWAPVTLLNNPSASSFSFKLTVASVGFYGGNTFLNTDGIAKAPAHTAVFDYFYNVDDGTQPVDNPIFNSLTINPLLVHGTITPDPQKTNYACGEIVKLTANPDPGWMFARWSGAISGVTSPADLTMNGSTTVGATFILEGTVDTTTFIYLPVVAR